MEMTENIAHSIHVKLNNLLQQKSQRDRVNFTGSQLANALDVPRSVIQRLLHPDPHKRVTNPKIETLLKIVDFFRTDGFSITVDDLLGTHSKAIDVQAQTLDLLNVQATIPVFAMDNSKAENLGMVDINIASHSNNLIAFLANNDIKPMFKKGSLFIVDKNMQPEDNTLVAVRLNNNQQVLVRKYYIQKHQRVLKSYDPMEETIVLQPTMNYELLGVVIQVNAKT